MRYPNVGDKIYWKDITDNKYVSICKRIDKDKLNTKYFFYISSDGGGNYVDEEEILDPKSDEINEFKNIIFNE